MGEHKREYFLARALADLLDRYDAVHVDYPPILGLLTVNALCACSEVVVPVDMEDIDALHGAEEVVALGPSDPPLVRTTRDAAQTRLRSIAHAAARGYRCGVRLLLVSRHPGLCHRRSARGTPSPTRTAASSALEP